MKKQQIKQLLIKYFQEKKVYESVNQNELDNVAEKLSKLTFITKDILFKYINEISYLIKESVDFSDTEYLLSQIINIINK
ncbi:hypothetical protein J2795_003093 [Chryseobacterium bernardetii]|uniref:Uncharacterized protein n=2 Tax=Chryseobacterium TaxID=59732 RepID=A0A543EKW1_9FLAO|nr:MULTISPECIES: hypothetical protein [Chryseobacterium]MDR6372248.1 hypothetical protein [Chryseobacterium vietnamense]MDR6442368.1 hypothetical protein [Chryseobacterium bernardetii]TQM22225.1 hypothetical protein FB551_1934 [Chryseobacterium aquifrigidense]